VGCARGCVFGDVLGGGFLAVNAVRTKGLLVGGGMVKRHKRAKKEIWEMGFVWERFGGWGGGRLKAELRTWRVFRYES
jgi:hypothetical protein